MYRKSSKTKSKTGKTVYDIVTEKITTLLEAGHIPWQKPWKMSDAPKNFVSHLVVSAASQAQKVADYILCIKEEAPDVTDRPSK
jgi:antirestriction protein ArdC